MEELAYEDASCVRLRLTERTCAALSRLNVFVSRHEQCPPEPNREIRVPKTARFEEYTSFLGDFHTIGAFSYAETPSLRAEIGRYCSIASHVIVFGERHPIERVTSSAMTYCFAPNWNKPQFIRAHKVLLGGLHQPDMTGIPPFSPPIVHNDVWIGQHVQLAQGITVGTGAVIGAGAVVTKNVAPYTIVGGNPAKPIRERFPAALAERLLALQWWLYDPAILWELGYRDPEDFCDRLDAALRNGSLPRLEVRTLGWRDILNEVGDGRPAASSLPHEPRVLMTSFGNTVFVDPTSGLRHGPPLPGNATVFVHADGRVVELDCPVRPVGAQQPANPQCDPALVLGMFEMVAAASGCFGLRKGALFLCAEPDGRVTLSRGQLGPWEQFRSDAPHNG